MTTTTEARALERINRIATAKSERDADHHESEAMGYMAALRDEGLLPECEHVRLMNALRAERMAWRYGQAVEDFPGQRSDLYRQMVELESQYRQLTGESIKHG